MLELIFNSDFGVRIINHASKTLVEEKSKHASGSGSYFIPSSIFDSIHNV